MWIFVPSTVISSWEYVAAVSCSCLTEAIPQRIIGQARYCRSLVLLDKIINQDTSSLQSLCVTDSVGQDIVIHWLMLFFIKLLYKAGCHIHVPEILLCTWTHTVLVVHRLHLCSWSHYYMTNIHHCRCAWTHILFASSRAWSHLHCKPMELLTAS